MEMTQTEPCVEPVSDDNDNVVERRQAMYTEHCLMSDDNDNVVERSRAMDTEHCPVSDDNVVERRNSEVQALLYADHEVKEEMVIGPTVLIRPVSELVQEYGEAAHMVADGSEYERSRLLGCKVELQDAADELQCPGCGHWALTAAELAAHRLTHTTPTTNGCHQSPDPRSTPERDKKLPQKTSFQCLHCRKSFSTDRGLTRHKCLHKSGLYACDQCGKTFYNKHSLCDHLRTDTGADIYSSNQILLSCRHCNKQFPEAHAPEKPYSCKDCDKNKVLAPPTPSPLQQRYNKKRKTEDYKLRTPKKSKLRTRKILSTPKKGCKLLTSKKKYKFASLPDIREELAKRTSIKEVHFQVIPGRVPKPSKLGLTAQEAKLLPGTPKELPANIPRKIRDPHHRVVQRRATAKPSLSTETVPVAELKPVEPTAGPSWAIDVPAGPSWAIEAQLAPVEPTSMEIEEQQTQPAAEPLFAVIVDNQDTEDLWQSIGEEVTIGCNDGSDEDEDETHADDQYSQFRGTVTSIGSAFEDILEDSDLLKATDEENDNLLAGLLGHLDFNWTSDTTEFTGQREQFTGLPGPTFPVAELAEPVDCFLKMVEPHFIDKIVAETNEYARTTIRDLDAAGKLTARSRLRHWTPTTQTEMYRFLALLIAQGLYHNPVESGYWTGEGAMPLFQRTMSYSRFILLKKFLHFTDNTTQTDDLTTDQKRLHKIQPVIDYFREQFKRLYYPHQEVAIDESLLKWKGLLSFVQKIGNKAGQVGIKTYELCDKNGYLWDFFYHTGSMKDRLDGTNEPQVDRDAGQDKRSHGMSPPSNSAAQIVIDLAKPLFGKGHTIVMDNFYNSPLLARYLKINKCDCYGTLRLHRQHIPDSLRKLTRSNLNPGDIVSSHTKDLTVIVWRDTGLVSMISTYHKPDVGHQTKYGSTKYKPAVVLDYNNSMGGVDRKDQIISAQPMERSRNLVWYKKVFRHLLNTAIFNSHVIYRVKAPKIDHRSYRQQIVSGLLRRFVIPRPEPPAFISSNVVHVPGRRPFKRVILPHCHFPISTGSKNTSCLWCSLHKKASRTAYKCKDCNVNLCLNFCFEQFHRPGN